MVAMIRLMPKGVMKGFRLSVVYKGIAAGGVMTAASGLSRGPAPPRLPPSLPRLCLLLHDHAPPDA